MIDFWSDWGAVLRPSRYNWTNFTAVHFSVEHDRRFGNLEWHVALAGLHVCGAHRVGEGDPVALADVQRMVDEIESGEARISIPLAEYEALRAASPIPGHVACQSGEVVE